MHQKKDWKTFCKFAHRLILEEPSLEGLLACGTDGEKALIDGFAKNFRFAIFLRCFIHFKDNIKRELNARGFQNANKQLLIDEIFGKVVENVKHCGLVDCSSEKEFDEKLHSLEAEWKKREATDCKASSEKNTFYEWFCRQKVYSVRLYNTVLFRFISLVDDRT